MLRSLVHLKTCELIQLSADGIACSTKRVIALARVDTSHGPCAPFFIFLTKYRKNWTGLRIFGLDSASKHDITS